MASATNTQVRYLMAVLGVCDHNIFPVLAAPEDGVMVSRLLRYPPPFICYLVSSVCLSLQQVIGVVLRQHLLTLLKSKRPLQFGPEISGEASRIATAFGVSDFSKPMSTPGLGIKVSGFL